jgi:hypothetical protein
MKGWTFRRSIESLIFKRQPVSLGRPRCKFVWAVRIRPEGGSGAMLGGFIAQR